MNATIDWDKDIMVVQLSGTLDFDKAYEFREKGLKHFIKDKVILSLKDLDFVGSTGMSSFVQTLAEISLQNPNGLQVCNVSLEYMRMLEPHFNEKFQVFENVEDIKNSITQANDGALEVKIKEDFLD